MRNHLFLKWNKVFAFFSITAMFWACSDSNDIVGAYEISSGSEIESSSSSVTLSSKAESSSSSSGAVIPDSVLESPSSSSKVIASSSSCFKECLDWSIPKEAYLNPDIKYGEMTDSRDGQVYKTVKIGNQVWMAQNLNYFTSDFSYKAVCHGIEQHCDVSGRLYTWAIAMDSIGHAKAGEYACGDGKTFCPITDDYQGICPKGWHLPTKAEFDTLVVVVGGASIAGKVLKSQVGWNNGGNGSDSVGFSALPAGEQFDEPGTYRGEGLTTEFWSATGYYAVGAQTLRLGSRTDEAKIDYNLKLRYLSVRCINDDGVIEYPSNSSAKVVSSSSQKISSSSSSQNNVLSSSEVFVDSSDFDWSLPKEAYFNPNIDYGKMTDSRDGQVYKTVKIGEQIWMAENLNYSDSVQTPSLLGRNWCFGNDPEKCKIAGRLYTWAAAIDSANYRYNNKSCGYGRSVCYFEKNYRGICPEGWHLPDTTEWKILFKSVNNNQQALRSEKGWSHSAIGKDDVGFSGVAVGYYGTNVFSCLHEKCFNSAGNGVVYLSAAEGGVDGAIGFCLDYSDYAPVYLPYEKSAGFSIRCIKD